MENLALRMWSCNKSTGELVMQMTHYKIMLVSVDKENGKGGVRCGPANNDGRWQAGGCSGQEQGGRPRTVGGVGI